MKRIIAAALTMLVGLMFVVLPGLAQGEPRLASLRVGLWPEYDQPSLLVIYWGELAPETAYPATVQLRMPARIVAPHVVAAQASLEGGVVEASYDAVVEGDWRIITFETNGPLFQFEYYDALEKDGVNRSVEYVWPGDYAIDDASVEFQQPPGAENFTSSPSLGDSRISGQDGLIYMGSQFGAVEAGQTFTVSADYTRAQDDLTVTLLSSTQPQAQTSTPAITAPVTQSSGGVDTVLLVVVAVVFFLLGAAAMRVAINLQQLNREPEPTKKRRKR